MIYFIFSVTVNAGARATCQQWGHFRAKRASVVSPAAVISRPVDRMCRGPGGTSPRHVAPRCATTAMFFSLSLYLSGIRDVLGCLAHQLWHNRSRDLISYYIRV